MVPVPPAEGAVPPTAPSLVRLGRLGPALQWLALVQGAWPPSAPASVRRVVVDESGAATAAFAEGTRLADEIADSAADLVVLGSRADPAAGIVVIAALLDLEPVQAMGTAATDGWAATTLVVRDGLRAARPHVGDPGGLLRAVASPALSRLTGLLAQSAVRRTPVVLDGSPLVCGAALVAQRYAPGAAAWWLAGSAPPNPAARRALAELGLAPLLDLALAEAAGAELALSVLVQAVDLLEVSPTPPTSPRVPPEPS